MADYLVKQQKIHIEESGPPNGQIALLIHGWSSSSFTWKPVIPSLSRRYRCIAVDLPGFGQSPPPRDPPTIAGYADTLAELIEELSDRAMLVLGHSMGGQIATTLALRHPVLVERMVLLNPALSGRLSLRVNLLIAPHVWAERYPVLEWLIDILARTPLDYTDWLLKPSNFAERAYISEDDYKRIRADARRRGQGKIRAICFTAMNHADLRGQLQRVETPALVVWGAEDDIVPLRDAGVVAAEWPGADLRIIPNAGHWPQFEQPATTLRHIVNFLGLPTHALDGRGGTEHEQIQIQETAGFLTNSEIGRQLNAAQRLRLASLLRVHQYGPGDPVASMNTTGDDMFIVMSGTMEVWLAPSAAGGIQVSPVRLAVMHPGQVAGELALLDGAVRSADLRAGPEGARLLSLNGEALAIITEDDPVMGMKIMQSLAVSLGRRMRLQNWQATRALEAARVAVPTRALHERAENA